MSNNQKKHRFLLVDIREEELPAEALAKGVGSSTTGLILRLQNHHPFWTFI